MVAGPHHSYQIMPPLASEEYAALKADIAQRGILVPVEVDEYGAILDGHHRVQNAHELGLPDWPHITRPGLTEHQNGSHARQVNLLRRHLAPEQKRALIEQQLLETPDLSDRQIALALGVSNSTVSLVRAALETASQVRLRDVWCFASANSKIVLGWLTGNPES